MRKKAWKLLGIILSLFFIPLLLAGCAGEKVESQAVYTIADATGDWGFPSPYGHYPRGPGYVRMSFIFDTLVWKDDRGFVPALAREWRYDPQDNSFSFYLVRNATWHDGRPFTAKDVVFTVEYTREQGRPLSC